MRQYNRCMLNKRLLNKIAALCLASMVTFTGLPMNVLADEVEPQNEVAAVSEGDDENTIHIKDMDDLLELADNCKLADYSMGLEVILDNDISLAELEDNEFAGITSFAGTFDGKGHTIAGLRLEGGSEALGLFRYMEISAVVKNLSVTGTVISSDSQNNVGGIAGINAGIIEGCKFRGAVTGTGSTGGIVGMNGASGVINKCSARGMVSSVHTVGGIAGQNRGVITSCTNSAGVNSDSSWMELEDDNDVSVSYEGLMFAAAEELENGNDFGGIAGYSKGVIYNCINEASVGYQHSGKNVGGIVGRQCGDVIGCTNNGKVYGKQDVGGIAGQFEPDTSQQNVKSVDASVQELHSLMNRAMNDMDTLEDTLHNDVATLHENASNASDTSDELLGEMRDVTQKNLDAFNQVYSNAGYAKGDISTDMSKEDIVDGSITSEDYDKALDKIQSAGQEAKDRADYEKAVDKVRIVSLSENFADNSDKLTEQMDRMYDNLSSMSANVDQNYRQLSEDMKKISSKSNEIYNQISQKVENIEGIANGESIMEDRSAEDPESEDATRISGCTNNNSVNGDRNAGGIAGNIGVEGTDSADDSDKQVGEKYVTRAVLMSCTNNGIITVKNENGGGIVGNMAVGYVADCVGKGKVHSESGNCLGGIAGTSSGTIDRCSSLAVLAGSKYIGGIAGKAEKIWNCYSMASILDNDGWIGAIAGLDTPGDEKDRDITVARGNIINRIYKNYYVSSSLYGINGVSYKGIAESLSYDELMAVENISDAFKNLEIVFVDEEENVIKRTPMAYGESLEKLVYPELLTPEGDYMEWEGISSDIMESNMVVQAVTTANVNVLSSAEKVGLRPVVLAGGVFTESAYIDVESVENNKPAGLSEDAVSHTYHVVLNKTTLDDKTMTRVRILNSEGGNAEVYRLLGNNWEQLDAKSVGSYEEVSITGNEAVLCVVSTPETDCTMLIAGIAAGAAVVLLAVVILLKNRNRKKMTSVDASDKIEDESDDN